MFLATAKAYQFIQKIDIMVVCVCVCVCVHACV